MDATGYGIIGCGWVMPSHAIGVRNLSNRGVELVAVADLDEARAQQAASRFGARTWYGDYVDLLARDDIQFVSVCLPHHLHRDVVIRALRAGKHVLCEKPLSISVEEADEMVEVARGTGSHLSVVFQHRHDLPFRRLYQAVRGNAFGKVLLCQVFHKSDIRRGVKFDSNWRDNWATVGGGVLMMQAIHFIDVLTWCVGPVASASARVANLAGLGEVEDTGGVVLEFESGALGVISSTNASSTGRLIRIEVHGTAGAAVIENGQFLLWNPSPDYVEEPVADNEPDLTEEERRTVLFGTGHVKQIADFVTQVREGRTPSPTAIDGRNMTALMRAIYESGGSGQTVDVRWLG